MEQLGIWLKEISKAKGTPSSFGVQARGQTGSGEREDLFIENASATIGESLGISCTGSPGEGYGTQQKPKIARLLSEQEPLQSDSVLLWYGQTFSDVDCQSDTLPVCVEWRLDQRAGCRKFCQYKAPLIDNCSTELGLHGQPFSGRFWDSKTIQVRPKKNSSTFSSVLSLSCVRLFETPWIAAHQASLSITNSQSSHKLMSIGSVMPSSHLILCRPLLLLPPIPPSVRVFSNEFWAITGPDIQI